MTDTTNQDNRIQEIQSDPQVIDKANATEEGFFDKKIGRLAFAINFIVLAPALFIIDIAIDKTRILEYLHGAPLFIVFIILSIFLFWSFFVTIFRLNDIGRPKAWILISFIPFGGLVLTFWCLFSESNSYNKNKVSPNQEEVNRQPTSTINTN